MTSSESALNCLAIISDDSFMISSAFQPQECSEE